MADQKKGYSRLEFVEKDINGLIFAIPIYIGHDPEHIMDFYMMYVIKIIVALRGYCSRENVAETLNVHFNAVLAMEKRLKSMRFVEENRGFLRVAKEGYWWMHSLEDERDRILHTLIKGKQNDVKATKQIITTTINHDDK